MESGFFLGVRLCTAQVFVCFFSERGTPNSAVPRVLVAAKDLISCSFAWYYLLVAQV